MKKILFCLLGILIITAACTKKSDPDPAPQNPELIGEWKGTTSQETQVEFQVVNVKGTLYISHYKVLILTSGGSHSYEATNTDGIASINNKTFKITLQSGSQGESFINGIFDGTGIMAGGFAIYSTLNANELITGTFTCVKNL
ncbi:MAG TPA: hypothetical protein VLR52_03550 [Bacteroidales bacterium]|nr:hypothetical protein [Bacteroidales bacterium]